MLLRFLPLVAAVAAWAPTGVPRGLAPAASLVSSRAAVLMKGRSQGDGPAKSTRRSIKTPALALQRAKVEAAKKRRAKAINAITPTLSAWTQGERFASMYRGGAAAHAVFARAHAGAAGSDGSVGDGEWLSVGSVCVGPAAAAAGVDATGAAQLQRRLIYEAAVRLYPVLGVHRRDAVELGVDAAGDGEPVLLPEMGMAPEMGTELEMATEPEMGTGPEMETGPGAGMAPEMGIAHAAAAPEAGGEAGAMSGAALSLTPGSAATPPSSSLSPLLSPGTILTARNRKVLAEALLTRAAAVGFAADALPSGIYRWASSEGGRLGAGKKDWAQARDKLGNDSKSAVATKFSESLALRGH